jgi:hypothetical protein
MFYYTLDYWVKGFGIKSKKVSKFLGTLLLILSLGTRRFGKHVTLCRTWFQA